MRAQAQQKEEDLVASLLGARGVLRAVEAEGDEPTGKLLRAVLKLGELLHRGEGW